MLPDSTDIHSRARPDGMVKGYYESGKLKSKVRYKYNLKTGKEKEYYETGKLKTVTHYKKGEPGITKRYDENGKEIK